MADELGSKTVVELKAMLKEQGLPVSGKKQELIARLEGNATSEQIESEPSITSSFNLNEIDWKNEKTQTIVAAIVLLIFIPISLSSYSWAYASNEETYNLGPLGSEVVQEMTVDFGLSEVELKLILNGEEMESMTFEYHECESEIDICTTFEQAGSTTYFFLILAMICLVVFLATSIIQMTNASKKVEQLKWFADYEDKTALLSKLISAGLLLFAVIWYPLKIFLDSEEEEMETFDSTGLGFIWWIMLIISLAWFWLVYSEMIRERWIPWIKQKIGK